MSGKPALDSPWTAEATAKLTELWAAGLSATECGIQLGMSRNAIIGKVHRLKLPRRRTTVSARRSVWHDDVDRPTRIRDRPKAAPKPKAKKAAKRWVEPRRSRLGVLVPPPIPVEPKKPNGDAWVPIDGTKPVSLIDLGAHQCRWPVTEDAPFLFCGAHADHAPYCQHHHQWSIGRGTAFERSAEMKAELAVWEERQVFEDAA